MTKLDIETISGTIRTMRKRVGAKTPSNLDGQVRNYAKATGEAKANLDKCIPLQLRDVERLARVLQ